MALTLQINDGTFRYRAILRPDTLGGLGYDLTVPRRVRLESRRGELSVFVGGRLAQRVPGVLDAATPSLSWGTKVEDGTGEIAGFALTGLRAKARLSKPGN